MCHIFLSSSLSFLPTHTRTPFIFSWHLYGLQIRVLCVPPKYPWYATLQLYENKLHFFPCCPFFVTWLSNSWNRDFGQKYYSCLVNWWTSSELVSRGSQGYILYLRSTPEGRRDPSLISPTLLVLLRKWLSTADLLNANCWQSRFTGRHLHYQEAENIFLLLSGASLLFITFCPPKIEFALSVRTNI